MEITVLLAAQDVVHSSANRSALLATRAHQDPQDHLDREDPTEAPAPLDPLADPATLVDKDNLDLKDPLDLVETTDLLDLLAVPDPPLRAPPTPLETKDQLVNLATLVVQANLVPLDSQATQDLVDPLVLLDNKEDKDNLATMADLARTALLALVASAVVARSTAAWMAVFSSKSRFFRERSRDRRRCSLFCNF
jgi:hypothetical protein